MVRKHRSVSINRKGHSSRDVGAEQLLAIDKIPGVVTGINYPHSLGDGYQAMISTTAYNDVYSLYLGSIDSPWTPEIVVEDGRYLLIFHRGKFDQEES